MGPAVWGGPPGRLYAPRKEGQHGDIQGRQAGRTSGGQQAEGRAEEAAAHARCDAEAEAADNAEERRQQARREAVQQDDEALVMARQTVCSNCGKVVEEAGWIAMPARIENGELVGTVVVDVGASQHDVIGPPQQICTKCMPVAHPDAEEKKRGKGDATDS